MIYRRLRAYGLSLIVLSLTANLIVGSFRQVYAIDLTHNFSGNITNQNGDPIAGLKVRTQQGMESVTTAEGHFSMDVPAGAVASSISKPTWDVQLPAFELNTKTILDATNSDVVQNFQIRTTTLTVKVLDYSGQPVSNISTGYRYTEQCFGTGPSVLPDNSGCASGNTSAFASTDSDGIVRLPVLRGVVLDYAWASFPNNESVTSFSRSNMSTDNTIELQRGRPSPPTRLQAISDPTRDPELTWDGYTGPGSNVDHYDVYRDDGKIGVATAPDGYAPVYVDRDSAAGQHVYYVRAISPLGPISDPSNKITVTVFADSTPPTVVGNLDRQANTVGWYNSDVTINWTATDPTPSSGTPTTPAPTIASQEGTHTYTSAQSCDAAGNCATGSLTLKIDKTKPTVSNFTMSGILNLPLFGSLLIGNSSNLSVNATDSLSGVTSGEYYVDNDPGQGNGVHMTYANGKLTATANMTNISHGRQHTVYVRAKDAAGNWSTVASYTFLRI
jgi:hypothetical protein